MIEIFDMITPYPISTNKFNDHISKHSNIKIENKIQKLKQSLHAKYETLEFIEKICDQQIKLKKNKSINRSKKLIISKLKNQIISIMSEKESLMKHNIQEIEAFNLSLKNKISKLNSQQRDSDEHCL